ncbi:B-cell antigen receptor complex-associated protein alpha chain [Seriola lalandi dorsalis]|uniref:CD79a molecule, immunoglobulin-associated alpha n=2 Tax=Seriola lalandi dorsalis TaxID=1841481 RepID=A0A3B4WGR5_SERLL|nr:B-cell antigen receptor complex-associated protein alpha chain [Seriola lalandi dorsalis]XP_056236546.1 B-cell antigen receptor complex-associated protein alpha chain [Seriola aureovittata]
MVIATVFVLCSFVVGTSPSMVTFKADRPFLGVPLSIKAELKCCYTTTEQQINPTWFKSVRTGQSSPVAVNISENVTTRLDKADKELCYVLTFDSVQLNDTGMYQCVLNYSNHFSPGTYLQVYKRLKKTINLRESTKNKILTAEGVLLLLCVVLPSTTLLFKSKKLHELEKKKMKKEEENIYQGLNLDDCCTTYDQIERSQAHGPYQDVCNIIEEEEEFQLEKP